MSTRRRDGLGVAAALVGLAVVGAGAARAGRTTASPHGDGAALPLPPLCVDLNSAPESELLLLPGIGPALAERIVAERQARGPFDGPGDLGRVCGVGAVTIERLAGHVTAR